MAKGYWIAHNQISDVDAYEAYKIAAAPMKVNFLYGRERPNSPKVSCAPGPL